MSVSVFAIALLVFAARCPPAAIVAGDEAIVSPVKSALGERGVRAPPLGCPALKVSVAQRSEVLELQLDTGDRRSIARSAKSPEEAATIIESWARADLVEPLLVHELPAEPKTVVTATPPEPRPFAFGAAATAGFGSDRSFWSGADLRGCFLVWVLCAGGRFAYAVDAGTAGDARALDGSRNLLDLGLIADVPVVLGDFELLPGIGAGQTIVRSERLIGSTLVYEDAAGLRLRAQLGLSWQFVPRLSVRIDGAVDYAPFARTRLLESLILDGPDNIPLAGEPRFMGWIRAGLELGGI